MKGFFCRSPVHSGEQKNIWICLGTSSAAIFMNFLWISLATLPLRFPQWPAAWTFEQGPLIVWPWNVNSRATTSKHSCVRLKEAALARLKNSYHVRLLYTYEVGLQTSTVHVSIVYNDWSDFSEFDTIGWFIVHQAMISDHMNCSQRSPNPVFFNK